MLKYYQYGDDDFRIVSIPNKVLTNDKEKNKTGITDEQEVKRIALSRSKRLITEYIKCNDFKYFFTVTVIKINCDRYDLEKCKNFIRKFMKKIKRVKPDFIYIFVTEQHKDGAFHFHGVCSDFPTYTPKLR